MDMFPDVSSKEWPFLSPVLYSFRPKICSFLLLYIGQKGNPASPPELARIRGDIGEPGPGGLPGMDGLPGLKGEIL